MTTIDMRDAFFERLFEAAIHDERIILLSADHGAFAIKKFEEQIPHRYINMGIAEQNMIGVAAGLALSGKIVFVYGISPFVSLRVLEQLTIDVASMNLAVNVISVGAGFTYSTDGATHHGLQDVSAVATIPGMSILNSSDILNTRAFVDLAIERMSPHYIRIEKEKFSEIPRVINVKDSIKNGYSLFGTPDSNLVIITTGITTQILVPEIAKWEKELNREICLIDIHQIRPFPNLEIYLRNSTHLLVVEEAYQSTIAQSISGILTNLQKSPKLFVTEVGQEFKFVGSSREFMMDQSGLSLEKISQTIYSLVKY